MKKPDRSDDVLVASFGYNNAGRLFQTVDPAGTEQRQSFDALGQVTSQVSNYTGGTPGDDTDVTILAAYNADGQIKLLTAVNPTTGDQVTQYLYGRHAGGLGPSQQPAAASDHLVLPEKFI